MTDSVYELVLDTLYDRGEKPLGSCLTVNEHGLKLIDCNGAAIPVIEEVMHEHIEPVLAKNAVDHPSHLSFGMPGLKYVLGAYLLIGKREQIPSLIGVLESCSNSLQCEIVSVFPLFFNRSTGDVRFQGEPTEQMLSFVKRLVNSPHAESAQSARRTLDKLGIMGTGKGVRSRSDE